MTSHTATIATASQTIGPFFHDCLLREGAQINALATPEMFGKHIRIMGQVLDGDGAAVPDAMIEIWQANAHGRYNHPADLRNRALDPAFTGYGRTSTDAYGQYWFTTVKPGAVPFTTAHMQAPHICVAVSGRGLLNHLFTRLYFADEPINAIDPILHLVPAERQSTLLAQPAESNGEHVYHFDIVLQGTHETAFFNFTSAVHR